MNEIKINDIKNILNHFLEFKAQKIKEYINSGFEGINILTKNLGVLTLIIYKFNSTRSDNSLINSEFINIIEFYINEYTRELCSIVEFNKGDQIANIYIQFIQELQSIKLMYDEFSKNHISMEE